MKGGLQVGPDATRRLHRVLAQIRSRPFEPVRLGLIEPLKSGKHREWKLAAIRHADLAPRIGARANLLSIRRRIPLKNATRTSTWSVEQNGGGDDTFE